MHGQGDCPRRVNCFDGNQLEPQRNVDLELVLFRCQKSMFRNSFIALCVCSRMFDAFRVSVSAFVCVCFEGFSIESTGTSCILLNEFFVVMF